MKHFFFVLPFFLAATFSFAQHAPRYGELPDAFKDEINRAQWNEARRDAAREVRLLERAGFDLVLSELDRIVTQTATITSTGVDSWGRKVLFPDQVYTGDLSDFNKPVVLKISDTGVFEEHLEFATANFLPPSNYTGTAGEHWHGSHVAGLVWQIVRPVHLQNGNFTFKSCQNLNAQGAGSMAWAVNMLQTERREDLGYLANGAAVGYNFSWGYTGDVHSGLSNEIASSAGQGVVFFAANGNTGGETKSYPASDPRTVSVAALTPSLERASFSTIGPFTTIAAPGWQLNSTLPDNQQGKASGTSMSSPLAFGCWALAAAKWGEPLQDQENARIYVSTIAEKLNGTPEEVGAGIVFVEAIRQTDPCDVPGIDCDAGENPGEPDEPDPGPAPDPELAVSTNFFDGFFMRWKVTGENGWRLLYVSDLRVEILGEQSAGANYQAFTNWLPSYFRNRGIEVPPGMDIADASFWTGQFLQYIAEQQGFVVGVDYITCRDESTGGRFYADGFKPLPTGSIIAGRGVGILETAEGVRLVSE